eukprot:scaffold73867_cov46-Phaeocystis_antarctica.AAC.1
MLKGSKGSRAKGSRVEPKAVQSSQRQSRRRLWAGTRASVGSLRHPSGEVLSGPEGSPERLEPSRFMSGGWPRPPLVRVRVRVRVRVKVSDGAAPRAAAAPPHAT